jgi:hypothetical protein
VKYKVTTTPQLFPGAVLKINGFELSELTNAAAGALVGLVILSKNGAIIEIEGASQEFIPIRLH